MPKMEGEMERPKLDDCSYRVVTLQNQLEVLFIHDAGTDSAGATLDVNVGSFSDTDDMPGIAHAVEHLLSLGTEKYPIENSYEEFFSQQGVFSNASTASTSTQYYFKLLYPAPTAADHASRPNAVNDKSPLLGALDRFGQFFISPLLLKAAVSREINSIDSEFQKEIQNDVWRVQQVKKALANPKHPYSRFTMGNLKTLMKLVVFGRESLNTLQEWVEKIFSKIPNKNLSQNRWDVPLYTTDELLTQTSVKPACQWRSLELQFMHRDEEEFYETHPSRYMTHLLNHKGPGSLFAYFRANGWATELEAGGYAPCPGAGLYSINVELTEKGLEHYREVVKVIFHYIAMVREQPPQEWIVDEIARICQTAFHFKEKCSPSYTANMLASIMQKPYNRTMLLSGSTIIRKFDQDLICASNSYFKPDIFRLIIVNPDSPDGWNRTVPWTGACFKVEKLSYDFLGEIKEIFESKEKLLGLHLPHHNVSIPSELNVKKEYVDVPARAPKLIRYDDNVRTWWKKDDQFWVPKANIHIYFRTSVTGTTFRSKLITYLFVDLLHDALVVHSYDAALAGLEYELNGHSYGFEITIHGYKDKLHVLLETVLDQVRSLVVKEERFDIVRDQMLHNSRDWDFEQPSHQVSIYSDFFRSARSFVLEDYPKELGRLTAKDVETFYPQIFARCQIEILAHGQLSREEALGIADFVEQTMKPITLPLNQLPIAKSIILPPGSDFVFEKELKDPENVNHCIEYSLYAGNCDDKTLRAKLHLLGQMTEEPCFNQLRTVEQLGYVVSSGEIFHEAWVGYSIIIQSERGCEYLESRVDAFLVTFEQTLQKMNEEYFESHKSAVIRGLREKLVNLSQEDERFWNYISNDSYDFSQADSDADMVTELTKDDMLSLSFSVYNVQIVFCSLTSFCTYTR